MSTTILLFKQDEKSSEAAPDYTGVVDRGNGKTELRSAAWIKKAESGVFYLSLKIEIDQDSNETPLYGAIFKDGDEYTGVLNINEERAQLEVKKRKTKSGQDMLICEMDEDIGTPAKKKPSAKQATKPAKKQSNGGF